MSLPELVGRGVHVCPFLNASGGMVLVSVTSAGRRLAENEVGVGENPLPTMEMMWDQLNTKDPATGPATGSHIKIVATLLLCTGLALARLYLLGYLRPSLFT